MRIDELNTMTKSQAINFALASASKLDVDERDILAIQKYTGMPYDVNKALRQRKKLPDDEYWETYPISNVEMVQRLKDLTKKHYTTRNITLWRGISGNYAKKLKTLEPGDIFTEKQFVSTSLRMEHAFFAFSTLFMSEGVLIKIKAPAGTPMFFVNTIDNPSDEANPEAEAILPIGTTFKVLKKIVRPYGGRTAHVLHCRIV